MMSTCDLTYKDIHSVLTKQEHEYHYNQQLIQRHSDEGCGGSPPIISAEYNHLSTRYK